VDPCEEEEKEEEGEEEEEIEEEGDEKDEKEEEADDEVTFEDYIGEWQDKNGRYRRSFM